MTDEQIKKDDDVLIINRRKPRKRWLLKIDEGGQFHTDKGIIKFDKIIGKQFGEVLTTNIEDVEFILCKPTIYDFIMKSKRKSQIIYPKDAAIIILFAGVSSGSRVIESGIGSGGLTLALANAVKPNGKVYGYEIREDFIKLASKNLERIGLSQYVEIKNKDATQGFEEENVDAIILDLSMPWEVIPQIKSSLKGSGVIASFSPTVDQVDKTDFALKSNNFFDINTIECFMRDWQVEKNRIRPNMRMVAHTGFLTFARKMLD